MQAECTSCEHNEIFVIKRDHWSTASRQIFFWHYFCFWSVHGPGAKPSYKNKKKLCMDPVHDRGSMDPWSMFCPLPATRAGRQQSLGRIGLRIGSDSRSDHIGSDRTAIFAFGAEELF